jgi:5-oxoprolinase (ATP-hydrolysing) subunit A
MILDINCDMGELPEAIADGTQEALMPHLTSVNIACGGHAGDEHTMRVTVDQATRHKLVIGAHPGYPDRANFGRLELDMPLDEVERTVHEQIVALSAFTSEIMHVKPHGALYNQAVNNRELAAAIARGTARFSRDVTLVGLASSQMLDVFREAGFRVAAEAFADRRYEADGALRSRKFADALIRDPSDAAEQALRIAKSGKAQTICIHGDTPGAVAIAAAVHKILRTI